MKVRSLALAVAMVVSSLVLLAGPAPSSAATRTPEVPRVIIDTDLSRWWDDATVIGIANVLQQQGDVRVLGVVSDVPNPIAVAAIDAINTAYGHGKTSRSAPSRAATPTPSRTATPTSRPPSFRIPSPTATTSPGAVALYRKLLAKQPDHSVTIVSFGGYTNLAGLLAFEARAGSSSRALVAEKIKRLVIMDGLFPVGGCPRSRTRRSTSPPRPRSSAATGRRPIAWVDGLGGIATKVGATLCTADAEPTIRCGSCTRHCSRADRPSDGDWDAPTLLYAVGDVPDVSPSWARAAPR